MINEKTKKDVWLRDNGACILTGVTKDLERTPHHCFYLSEYFEDDKNDAWNLVIIGREPHRFITFPANDEEVQKGKKYAKKCKEIALSRYTGKHRDILIRKMRERYGNSFKR